MGSIAHLVQSLPQEIYDQVYDLVFYAAISKGRTIDRTYRPPPQLHVSRAIREDFSETLYRDATFTIGEEVLLWARSIPAKHFSKIGTIRIMRARAPRSTESPDKAFVQMMYALGRLPTVVRRPTFGSRAGVQGAIIHDEIWVAGDMRCGVQYEKLQSMWEQDLQVGKEVTGRRRRGR